jgi:hypothetical protein
MKSLPIVWQRLVSPDGKTCDRCSATYEMQRAVSKLKEALAAPSVANPRRTVEVEGTTFETIPEKLFSELR